MMDCTGDERVVDCTGDGRVMDCTGDGRVMDCTGDERVMDYTVRETDSTNDSSCGRSAPWRRGGFITYDERIPTERLPVTTSYSRETTASLGVRRRPRGQSAR